MGLTAGLSHSRSFRYQPTTDADTPAVYRRWFIGFGLTGLLYSSFAWSVLLAGNGKSRVELAMQLPLKGMIRLLEWVHCPGGVAIVLEVFPPITALLCGVLALGVCWGWRSLRLKWERAKFVLLGAAAFECLLLAYGCGSARLSEPGPQGHLALPGSGDVLLGLALMVLFVCGISLVALSPAWNPDRRAATSTSGS